MKLLSFSEGNRESWGAIGGEAVVDLGLALPQHPTLADFLGSPDYDRRDAIVAAQKPGPKLEDIKFLPVIPRPEKIVCAVRNYLDHHNEAVAFGMKRHITEFPPIFLRVSPSQVAHNAPALRPQAPHNFDQRRHLALVTGHGGRHNS